MSSWHSCVLRIFRLQSLQWCELSTLLWMMGETWNAVGASKFNIICDWSMSRLLWSSLRDFDTYACKSIDRARSSVIITRELKKKNRSLIDESMLLLLLLPRSQQSLHYHRYRDQTLSANNYVVWISLIAWFFCSQFKKKNIFVEMTWRLTCQNKLL